jgi:Predicted permeases
MLADLTLTQHILSVVSGVAVGFTLGLIGGGGSILAVPLLLYLVGYPNPHVVIGTTALAVSINAYLNLIPHARAGNVRWKEAVIFAIVGAIAAYIGSTLGKAVDGKKLLFLFAILMLVIAALMIRPKKVKPGEMEGNPGQFSMWKLVVSAAIVGTLSGFFGIGGGFLIVPGLVFATGMPMLAAVGSSLFSVGTFGLTTAVNYASSGLLDWTVAGLISPGALRAACLAHVWPPTGQNQQRHAQPDFCSAGSRGGGLHDLQEHVGIRHPPLNTARACDFASSGFDQPQAGWLMILPGVEPPGFNLF